MCPNGEICWGFIFFIMEEPVFKIGQEVFLEKNYPVWAQVAKKYVYVNRPFSEELITAHIHLGELYTTDEIAKRDIKEEANHIANLIWKVFFPYYYSVEFEVCKKFVEDNIDINKKLESTEFTLSEGWFIITKIVFHPESNGRDYYPAYHSYKAIKKDGIDGIEFNNWEYYNNQWHFANREQPKK